eukprot:3760147-Karenia_brevis.AAC.1
MAAFSRLTHRFEEECSKAGMSYSSDDDGVHDYYGFGFHDQVGGSCAYSNGSIGYVDDLLKT